ncbi:hypothetical protein WDU99_08720 [Microbacterium sp. Mu-80]|uniref:DUF4064 domain-containing protein n=1 Tax=Microbacterium bandirmense TaxID=3122050 RepID=A0ABU8LCH3_9MICO
MTDQPTPPAPGQTAPASSPFPANPFGPPPPPPAPYAPPTGAYGVPVGGYTAPAGGYTVPSTERPASRGAGAIALIAAVLAAVVMPILGAVFAFQIGALLPVEYIDVDTTLENDLAALSPARIQVLWAEIAFWAGTALGVLALVMGIIAVARRRGRGLGIAAIVVAVIGPVLFFVAVFVMLGIGAAVGTL